ncbi:MAG: hypothetical protein KGI71_02550 [Patescibacteria group bacterium]|nr:hypothetical protein [Patescibacteria group bacterium]
MHVPFLIRLSICLAVIGLVVVGLVDHPKYFLDAAIVVIFTLAASVIAHLFGKSVQSDSESDDIDRTVNHQER